ncbi:MAG: TonB-dependent receptor [Ferruginibacter sp.]|nr:TonB-dependent receptor [Ferruginibacter sp.]
MKKIILLLTASISFFFSYAQRVVSGIVTDAQDGSLLSGVSVRISGSGGGTSTAIDGRYSLTVPDNARLLFSLVDYADLSIMSGTGTSLNVSLTQVRKNLQEVVVTGYNTQTRRQSTSSIARVAGDDVKSQPIGSFEQMLQGKAPGILIQSQSGQPGSAATVTIRGKGSVLGSTDPLYIMDGVQISSSDFQSVNASDIETYNVLKDAMGTAQYGSRGANGVIVITTKRGVNKKTVVNYDVQFGVAQLPKSKLELFTSAEKIDYELNYDRPDGKNPFGWTPEQADSLSQVNGNLREALFRKSLTMQHQLSLSGGNDKTKFFASGSLFDQEGVVISTNLRRITGRINLDHTLGNFRIGVNTYVGSSIFRNTNENDQFIGSPLNAVRWANPYVTPYLPDGSYNELDLDLQGQPNAVKELLENPVKNKQLKLIGGLSLEYRFPTIKGLTAKSNIGIDYTENENQQYFDRSTYQGSQQTGGQGSFGQNTTKNTRQTITSSLAYAKQLRDSRFNISLFNEIVKRNFDGFGYTGFGLVGPFKNGAGITPGTSTNGFIPVVTSTASENAILSWFAIGDYSWKNKYFLSGTVRRDGSSRLADNNKWTTFGAAGASWVVSSEQFMSGSKTISDLKLKASYGSSANQGVGDDYEAKEQFGATSYNGVGGLILTNLKKGDLTWEVRRTLNLGIDFGMFKNKLTGSVEWYNANTVGLYLNRQISGTTGNNTILTNLGKLQNRGVEVALNYLLVDTKNFSWNIGGNFTYNRNKILQLDGTDENVNGLAINRVGEAANSIYVVRYAGVDPANGDALYVTKDGKTTTNQYDPNDKVIVGKFDPPYFGGATTGFKLGGIEASFLFTYSFGNKIFNGDRVNVENPTYYVSNLSRELLTEWRNPGDITNIPSPFNDFQSTTTRFVEDGKYVRLRNIMVSYTAKEIRMGKLQVNSARFFVQGQNVYTWSNFRGYDPEIASGNLQGAQYPALRAITVGLNLSL